MRKRTKSLRSSSLRWLLLWPGILIVTYLAYRAGLGGGFQFDDFVNLPSLGAYGPVDDFDTFLRYLTSGTADPTGRPLAMLSFLLDARDWPAEAAPFLHTNIIIHLVNGSLLLALLLSLERALGPSQYSRPIAVLGASLWMLHPLLVSTTLYIVQREAMLAASFALLAMLGYLNGRARMLAGRENGLWLMTGSVLGGTIAATLCKANGILVPLLLLVLEFTVLRAQVPTDPLTHKRLRTFRRLMLVVPSLAIFLYLASFLPAWNTLSTGRDWTVGERALTQGRAIMDYLRLLLIPSSMSTGLYNDAYPPSRGLLQPVSTAVSLLAVVALAVLAVKVRSRMRALSASLLFFLAGHALESSLLPLELYFEHRNYLPALLLGWPVARGTTMAPVALWTRVTAAGLLLTMLAVTTLQRTQVWGDPTRMALLWAAMNPGSARAQSIAATAELSAGRPQDALARLRPLWMNHPSDVQLGLNYINAACANGGLTREDKTLASTQLFPAADLRKPIVRNWLERAIAIASSNSCPGIDVSTVSSWIDASQRASGPRPVDAAAPLLGILALEQGRVSEAVTHLRTSLRADPTPENAAGQVAILASAGHYRAALAQLDFYEGIATSSQAPGYNMTRVHTWVLRRQDYWPTELRILRSKLNTEIASSDD